MSKPAPKVTGAQKVEALIETIQLLASHVNQRFVADSEKVKAFSRCVESQTHTASATKVPATSD